VVFKDKFLKLMHKLHYFLTLLALLLFTSCGSNKIMTVNGYAKVDEGIVFSHEHMVTDFRGQKMAKQNTYTLDQAFETIIPHLMQLKARGVTTIFECTPEYIGRDVDLLKRLSDSSGIKIITNTGFYAAVNKKYLPENINDLSVEDLYDIWESEWLNGIQGSGIRPGFIKLGVGTGKIDSTEKKLLTAAIMLSQNTNLTIAMHTGDGEAAFSEYEHTKTLGLRPEKMIWVHAQNGTNEERVALTKRGVWVSLDGISEFNISEYVAMIKYMKDNDVLNRLLISHDDGWSVNEGPNQEIKLEPFKEGYLPFLAINNMLVPELQKLDFTKAEINTLLFKNPRKAYALK
jgi:phosphotriesterase-related protein